MKEPSCSIHDLELFEGECGLCRLEARLSEFDGLFDSQEVDKKARLIADIWAGFNRMAPEDQLASRMVYSIHGDYFLFSATAPELEYRFIEIGRM